MLSSRTLLALALFSVTLGLMGCGQGELDGGPQAAYSGAPGPNSGAAGSGAASGASAAGPGGGNR